MNSELIKTLAKQAEDSVVHCRALRDGQIERTWKPEDFYEEFAKLIVKECARVANENVGAFTPGCGNSVLDHFGVQE